ncbi:hypothetical protein Tco_0109671, partial [Tanacetum coccineum]
MEFIRHKPSMLLPYGMLLTRLYHHVMEEFPELVSENYVYDDCVMLPLALHYERKTRSDRGTKISINPSSSSHAFEHPSSSHGIDDDDDDS